MSDDKYIGDYILEEEICAPEVIQQALARQVALKEEGFYKPLGSILVEEFNVNLEKLLTCTNRMYLDILRSSATFSNFKEDLLAQIVF